MREECFSQQFKLADGRTAYVRWVNGPPYLSIWYKPKKCSRCDGDGKAHGSDRPFAWSADPDYMKCPVCKGSGVVE